MSKIVETGSFKLDSEVKCMYEINHCVKIVEKDNHLQINGDKSNVSKVYGILQNEFFYLRNKHKIPKQESKQGGLASQLHNFSGLYDYSSLGSPSVTVTDYGTVYHLD